MNEKGKKVVLFGWLGHGDIGNSPSEKKLAGALFQAIEKVKPDEVYLLNGQNYGGKFSEKDVLDYLEKLKKHLGDKLVVQRVEGFNPIDYREICNHVIPFLDQHYEPEAETYFLQTSGTPSTAVAWILLAQTRCPARLLQTSKEHDPEVVDLPFRVVADFIPSNEDAAIRELVVGDGAESGIIHGCDAMKTVLAKTDRVALHDVPVLLLGESGTGKELFAKRIHEKSGRTGRLVIINCGAISETLAESEFFGHKKGAFTGAIQDKKGKFEEAHDGTLFLDEVGELSKNLQVKLLRVLQEGVVVSVGGSDEITVDVRVIAATHRNLLEDVAEGRFREDLFYRLAVGVLQIPPLRERDGDALLIAEHMLEEINRESKDKISYYKRKKLGKTARQVVESGEWLGNVRELINTIHRVCIWTDRAVLTADDIEAHIIEVPGSSSRCDIMERPMGKGLDVKDLKKELQDHYLKRAYERTNGSVTKMAELIGLSRNAISDLLKKMDPKS